MARTLTVLFRRDPARDRRKEQIHYRGYRPHWPDGRPVDVGLDAFCQHGQRLLGLNRLLARSPEGLVRLINFPVSDHDENIRRLPGHRVRRFYIERQGQSGRIYFMDGTPTDIVFHMTKDEDEVLHWIGSALVHHGRAHRFFSHARWCVDQVGLAVVAMVVGRFVAAGAAVVLAVDDSLFRRYGRRVHAAAWQHDGSAQGPRKIGFGNCWVIVGIVATLPVLSRPVCLPVLFRLWRPKAGTSKVEHAVALVRLLAHALPSRSIHVVADAAYHGPACRSLPDTVSWTCRLQRNAVLYDRAPARTGKRGRPRLKGVRLGTPTELAATATWRELTVSRYGRLDTVHIAVTECLWYGAFGPAPVQVVLVREDGTTEGYDLALVSTDLTTPAPAIITRYASRWSIEVVNLEAKHVLGVGQARNRLPKAVERTVPFGLLTMSLVMIWYSQHGYHPDDVIQRQILSPWYPDKTEPSFEDMLVKLRRALIAARFMPTRATQPTPQEILAVQQAWSAAAA